MDEVLLQTAQESLQSLERIGNRHERFDNVLVVYVRGARVMPDPQSRLLVNQYLRSLELLSLHQNDRLFNQTLALLTDPLDRSRVVEFMDNHFEPFAIVLQTLQAKGQELHVSRVLWSVFTVRTDETFADSIQAIGWDREVVKGPGIAAKRVKIYLKGSSLEEIYNYFTALLPDQEFLSASLSQWLLDY